MDVNTCCALLERTHVKVSAEVDTMIGQFPLVSSHLGVAAPLFTASGVGEPGLFALPSHARAPQNGGYSYNANGTIMRSPSSTEVDLTHFTFALF